MRILYHYKIASKDGQFVHVEELTNALRRAGHELVIAGPELTGEKSFGSKGGFFGKLRSMLPRAVYEILEFMYGLAANLRLWLVAIRVKPDFIYERYSLYLPGTSWVSRLVGRPLLLEVNAPLCDERTKFNGLSLRRFARWTENYAWRNADAALPVTGVLARQVIESGARPEDVHVIHNGIQLSKFDDLIPRAAAKDRLAIGADITFGFVGFIRDWHRLDIVLDVLAQADFPASSLLVIGDGPALPDLKKQAADQGLADRVKFAGLVDRDKLLTHMAAFDVALQPSVVPYASPLKLFEYMGMGLPIIAPDSENIREVLTHDVDSLLVAENDAGSIGDAMLRLAQDASLRERLGKAARQRLEGGGFTWDGNAERVVGIARQIIEDRAGGGSRG